VMVADDQHLVRSGLSGMIESTEDLRVIAQARSGEEAVRLALRERPDVVLMDIRMPGLDGIQATAKITAAATGVRVLILTTFDLDDYVYAALRNGASGFLLKDSPPADLFAGIRIVAAGDAQLAPAITRRLIADLVARPEPVPQAPGTSPASVPQLRKITPRERQVLVLVAEGLSNAEIGQRLHISQGTAKTHVANLLTKLDARDRVQLVILSFHAGLVTPR
jgi:DNA-binding NarL/FixJ family response regulator